MAAIWRTSDEVWPRLQLFAVLAIHGAVCDWGGVGHRQVLSFHDRRRRHAGECEWHKRRMFTHRGGPAAAMCSFSISSLLRRINGHSHYLLVSLRGGSPWTLSR